MLGDQVASPRHEEVILGNRLENLVGYPCNAVAPAYAADGTARRLNRRSAKESIDIELREKWRWFRVRNLTETVSYRHAIRIPLHAGQWVLANVLDATIPSHPPALWTLVTALLGSRYALIPNRAPPLAVCAAAALAHRLTDAALTVVVVGVAGVGECHRPDDWITSRPSLTEQVGVVLACRQALVKVCIGSNTALGCWCRRPAQVLVIIPRVRAHSFLEKTDPVAGLGIIGRVCKLWRRRVPYIGQRASGLRCCLMIDLGDGRASAYFLGEQSQKADGYHSQRPHCAENLEGWKWWNIGGLVRM